jgi:diguanylate cyclase (GGDEF)-like protein
MGRFWRGLLGLLGGILLLPLLLLAQPLTPDPAPVIRFDQGQLSVLRDPTQRLSLDQVRAAFAQGQFQPLPGNLGAGYVPDAFWLRFSLDRPPTQAAHWWLEVMPPYLDHIQLFHIDPTGQIDQRQGGDRLPQSAKEEAYRGTLFKLDLSPGSHEFYLRLQTTSTMTAIVKLWLPSAFAAHLRNSYFSFGLYFSLILAVSIFNAVNWMVSRRSIFLLYVVYLLLNALQWLGINGFVAEFLFPAQPLLANLTLGLTLSLAACVAFLFFAVVFELRRYHRTVYAINRLGALMALVTAIGTPFGYYQTLVPGLLLIALLSIFAALWPMQRLWRIGEPWSRLLVCAYIMFSGLMIFNILGSLAILPFSETSLYAGMLSNLFHILLLHFAILLHYRRVEKLSILDSLTGLYNRRRFDEALNIEWTRAIRSGQPVALIIIDVDFFKKFNDRYGHQAGDECLRQVASAIKTNAGRITDLAVRYGGEEFCVLAPYAHSDQARVLAEATRRSVEELAIMHEDSAFGRVTISVGLSVMIPDSTRTPQDFLRAADEALYQAKASGRNRVIEAH